MSSRSGHAAGNGNDEARRGAPMSVCAEHNVPLVDEPGGDDMPTLYGRRYCPACQERFAEAVDAVPPKEIP